MHDEIIKVVENQMRLNDPPETKQTYDRLLASGISKTNTLKYLGQCVAVEIYCVMKNKELYNNERYIKNLLNLPEFPSEEL